MFWIKHKLFWFYPSVLPAKNTLIENNSSVFSLFIIKPRIIRSWSIYFVLNCFENQNYKTSSKNMFLSKSCVQCSKSKIKELDWKKFSKVKINDHDHHIFSGFLFIKSTYWKFLKKKWKKKLHDQHDRQRWLPKKVCPPRS